MNGFTGTPVNTVWFTCGFAILLGLLVFAGEQAINAIFSLSIVALYIAYAYVAIRFPQREIVILTCLILQYTHRSAFPRTEQLQARAVLARRVQLPHSAYLCFVDALHGHRLPLPDDALD